MIQGVEILQLITHVDERGFFREILRNTDELVIKQGMGQISHSLVYQGVIKAWHYHHRQTQWNYVLNGLIKVALHDLRKDSPTYRETMEFISGDNQPAKIYSFPPGVAHGYKCIQGPMNIIYITSGTYDLSDEGRIPNNDKMIDYNWLEEKIK